MKKWMAVAAACALAACNSGGPITGPSSETPEATAPAPVAAATPAPQTVTPTQDPKASFEVDFKDNAGFRVNYVGSSGARVVAFITSFDDQDTPLASKQRDLTSNQAWEDSFETQCVQLDIDQPGVKLIAAAFYDKQGKRFAANEANAAKIEECRCTPEWVRTEQEPEVIYGKWEGPKSCGIQTRTVTFRYTETQTCTNASRTVDVEQESETKEVGDTTSFNLGTLSYPTYTPVYTNYYQMNQGSAIARANACANRGGSYGLWGYPTAHLNFSCKIQNQIAGEQGNDVTLVGSVKTGASGGNPISGSASFSGAGEWKLILYATPGNHNLGWGPGSKDGDSKTLSCGEQGGLSVSYPWIGHGSENWFMKLYHNGSLVATSPTVHNPSN